VTGLDAKAERVMQKSKGGALPGASPFYGVGDYRISLRGAIVDQSYQNVNSKIEGEAAALFRK
jgi:hypothetical protein